MSVSEPVVLHWGGADYTIPPDKITRCIEAVEDVLTIGEAIQMIARPNTCRIARAYAVMLNFAADLSNGKLPRVTQEDVRTGMFTNGNGERIAESVMTILKFMVPPEFFESMKSEPGTGAADATPGNGQPRRARRAAASSKKPSKRS